MNLDCPPGLSNFIKEALGDLISDQQLQELMALVDEQRAREVIPRPGHNPPVIEKQIRGLSPTRLRVDEEDLISDSNLPGGYGAF